MFSYGLHTSEVGVYVESWQLSGKWRLLDKSEILTSLGVMVAEEFTVSHKHAQKSMLCGLKDLHSCPFQVLM